MSPRYCYWHYPGDLHKLSTLVHDTRLATYLLTTLFFSSENRKVLEKKHHVCDLGSTETVICSKVEATFGHSISWYDGSTGVKIKSGGRIEFEGLTLKINSVQLEDAGTYECRGVSSTGFLTIYVNGEISLRFCCLSSRHYFRYILY